MKKAFVFTGIFAAVFIIASCNNDNTSTETKPATETPAAAPEKKETIIVKDTAKTTTVTVGPDGAAISTKKGTSVSVDKGGAKVGTKDVNIDIKTGN